MIRESVRVKADMRSKKRNTLGVGLENQVDNPVCGRYPLKEHLGEVGWYRV